MPRGNSIFAESSEFIGYSVCAKDIPMIQAAYNKIRSLHTEACHIVCAYIPNTEFIKFQDFVDDDEHFTGSCLLSFLKECNIDHRAIFVVQRYDGKHIGPKCFMAMIDAAKVAIQCSPYNSITGEHQCPWKQKPL